MFFALVAVAALVVVAGAAAANGGFTPVQPHSPNAKHINTAYYVILGFTSAIFVLVEGALVTFIVKYRRRGRPRTEDGAQVHGHTRLELIWTVDSRAHPLRHRHRRLPRAADDLQTRRPPPIR